MNHELHRRTFIKNTGMAGMAVGLSVSGIKAFASEQTTKVRLGMIGVGLRGQNHLEIMLPRDDVEVIALADPDSQMMAAAHNLITASVKKPALAFGTGSKD